MLIRIIIYANYIQTFDFISDSTYIRKNYFNVCRYILTLIGLILLLRFSILCITFN